MKKNSVAGVLFTVGSALLYGVCAVLTKSVSAMGLPVSMILLGKGAAGSIIALAVCAVTRNKIKIAKTSVPKVMILGFFGMCATFFLLNTAYTIIPVGTATTIHYLYPVLVCIVSALLFKEKIPPVAWITIALSFAGIAILPDRLTGASTLGIALAAMSAATWMFYIIYVERSGVLIENKLVISFYMCLILLVFGFAYGAITRTLDFSNLARALPRLGLIVFLSNILASVLFQKGVEIIGAGMAAILSVFEPIASIAFGALIMKENLTARQIAGCGIILVAVLLLMVYNAVKAKKRT